MDSVSRRRVLRSGLLCAAGLAGCQGTQDADDPTGSAVSEDDSDGPSSTVESPDGELADLRLRGEPLAEGFASPVGVEALASDELFVVDQPGQIHRVDADGRRSDPFLDVSDRMVDVEGFTEQGLLGLAFHPDYPDDERFFVRYSVPLRSDAPDDYSHTFVLSSFTTPRDAETADPASETVLLEIDEPQSNHNAGALAFGPDGYLYVAVGDGGGGGDQGTGHVDDWYDAVPGGNGQDVTENLLGSILRIDVDQDPTPSENSDADGDDRPYGVPDDNPLVGEDGRDEQFAWGFRNPWRMSFGPDGRLFVADVGQSAYEEVDVVEKGGNYGWNVREGTHCFEADDCPDETPDGDPLLAPVIEYPHEGGAVSGVSVTGGYLYDGDAIPALSGTYVFADWQAEGELFVARERSDGLWPVTPVPVEGIGSYVPSFGRDANGELLVCASDEGGLSGTSGALYRLREA